jgi:hypothetical protein
MEDIVVVKGRRPFGFESKVLIEIRGAQIWIDRLTLKKRIESGEYRVVE